MTCGLLRFALFTLTASACGGLFPDGSESSADGDDGGGAGREPLGEVTSWPAFEHDCDVPFDGAIRVIQGSGLADVLGFSVGSWQPGAIVADPYVSVDFRPAAGMQFDVDRNEAETASDFDLAMQVGNTSYSNRHPHQGETRGEVIVEEFDPRAGTATVEFIGVMLLGQDAVYAGDYRCGLSGRLSVVLGRAPLHEPCREDHECGGTASERVCGFDTLVCEIGCHDDDDCAAGSLCDGETCTPQ
jgi:hypothetical protein